MSDDNRKTTIKKQACSGSTEATLLYGVVQWFAGNPILDGMSCFDTKAQAIENANEKEKLSALTIFDVEYTVIRIVKAV
jgi:hypothetical protein